MILLDRPYASNFLHTTIADNALPVVMTEAARGLGLAPGPHVLDENAALALCREAHLRGDLKLYFIWRFENVLFLTCIFFPGLDLKILLLFSSFFLFPFYSEKTNVIISNNIGTQEEDCR